VREGQVLVGVNQQVAATHTVYNYVQA
jgi:hypothetical protein